VIIYALYSINSIVTAASCPDRQTAPIQRKPK
jgi:hypothetical protein